MHSGLDNSDKRIILEGNATNVQFCATIFVTVAIQPGFENNPKQTIMTKKIPACGILINKLRWILISVFMR